MPTVLTIATAQGGCIPSPTTSGVQSKNWYMLMNDQMDAIYDLQQTLQVGALRLLRQVSAYRNRARDYFYNVLYTAYSCPKCSGRLSAVGPGESQCTRCGVRFDSTLKFQRSPCCQARLVRRRCHYGCQDCGALVRSRFLFDERVFDAAYFRERVAASRARRKQYENAMRRQLAEAHTAPLVFTSFHGVEAVQDLSADLDALLAQTPTCPPVRVPEDDFCLETYRDLVRSRVRDCVVHFDAIPSLCKDAKTDRARRFTALISMEHDREIALDCSGGSIVVRAYAIDAEG